MNDQPTSTSSQASEASPSLHDGQDSGPSPSAKSTATARKSSPKTFWPTPNTQDSKGAGSMKSRMEGKQMQLHHAVKYGQTSSTSTEPPTEAVTCSQADFLASLSALPGSVEALQMTVRSGLRCSALLAKQDPLGCLAKTFLASSRWNSTTCYLTWKASATPAGRLLFQLVPSMPDTDETDSGLWHTPTSRDHKDGTAQSCANVPVNGLLGRAIHQYPTPG